MSDRDERVGGGAELVRWDRQDLRLVMGHLRDDDHRRRSVALDIELDPPKTVEWDGEGNPARSRHHETAIRHGENGLPGSSAHPKLFIRLEDFENLGLDVERRFHAFTSS